MTLISLKNRVWTLHTGWLRLALVDKEAKKMSVVSTLEFTVALLFCARHNANIAGLGTSGMDGFLRIMI